MKRFFFIFNYEIIFLLRWLQAFLIYLKECLTLLQLKQILKKDLGHIYFMSRCSYKLLTSYIPSTQSWTNKILSNTILPTLDSISAGSYYFEAAIKREAAYPMGGLRIRQQLLGWVPAISPIKPTDCGHRISSSDIAAYSLYPHWPWSMSDYTLLFLKNIQVPRSEFWFVESLMTTVSLWHSKHGVNICCWKRCCCGCCC